MSASDKPVVIGICMGSKSDLPVMEKAARTLDEFGVGYEIRILSAHRTPAAMFEYGRNAVDAGIEVIIAGAGGAAHLPGMLAALTTLPVVGVPVPATHLDGLDSLLSIVQMPRGTPVATVGIGNAINAAHLALRILSVSRPALRAALQTYQSKTATAVSEDDQQVKRTRGS